MNNSISMPNYCDGPYPRRLPYENTVSSAWTEVWTGACRSSKRFWFPGVAIWTDFWVFFRFWVGLVIYSPYQMRVSTRIKSYLCICLYPGKDASAWTVVWSGPNRARASITVPGGRELSRV